MAVDKALDRVTRRRRILDELIRQEGIQRYGLFSVTTEGKLLPDGSESASGFVVDAEDRVFYFWLDWDDARRRIVFTTWDRVQPEADWAEDSEYRAARLAAGLS
jgi:hypothetical protein